MIKSKLVKKVGYFVLDLVTFKKGIPVLINNFRLKLPAKYFRLFPSDYEKENFEYIISRVKENDVVLDIGAHIGLMAAVFGKKVKKGGRVFSFEPTTVSYNVLCNTIAINGLKDIVIPVNAAVGGNSGKVIFFISDTAIDVGNSMVKYGDDKKTWPVEIDMVSIDDFVKSQQLNKVDFIKIDAEGAEYKVLLGGLNTFTTFKPLIILALHPEAITANNDTLELIYDQVNKMNYSINYNGKKLDREAFCERKQLFDVHLLPYIKDI